jgi:hypothetical protein
LAIAGDDFGRITMGAEYVEAAGRRLKARKPEKVKQHPDSTLVLRSVSMCLG